MDDHNFLKFKKPLIRHAGMSDTEQRIEIRFMLTDAPEASMRVRVVDSEMKPVNVDYRFYSGAISNSLKEIENIRLRNANVINWGTIDDDSISLADNPQLLHMLSRCDNVVDSDGQPITFSDETARVWYDIKRLEASSPGAMPMMRGGLRIDTVDGPLTEPRFLSDSFLKAGNTVYPILSIGDNYENISSFLVDFPASQICPILSVFFSYIDNIKPIVEGYDMVYTTSKERLVPTIVVEKVDSDKALYLRVQPTAANMSADMMDKFYFTRIVSAADSTLVVKDVEAFDNEKAADEVENIITRYAPSRKEGREIYRDNDLFIIPENVAASFLFRGLPTILTTFRVIGTDKLKLYKFTTATPRLNVKLSSGIDFLEGTATVDIADEKFTLGQILEQYSRNHYVELADGCRAIIDETYMRRLERIFRRADKNDNKVKISFFDLPEIESLINDRLKGPGIERSRKLYEGFNKLASKSLKVKGLKATLRPYQEEGVKWIKYLYDNNLGGCLADDMGLGKTIQTIAMLLQIYPKCTKPSLIVMPKSLVFNWENELEKFAPSLTHSVYYGNNRNLEEALKSNVVLTTYAIARNDIDQLRKVEFEYVILDESQNIKNLAAQVTKSTFLLQAAHRLAISGTPIENNLTELYSLFHFLNPTMFGTSDDFNTDYTYPIQRDGDELAAEQLRRKVFPFILRRLKKDVLTDLPDRIDQTVYVEMSEEHAAFYERRRRSYQEQINASISQEGIQKSQFLIFQALSELRRVASIPESLSDGRITSPKLEALDEQLESAVTNGHKVVVFFNFIAGMELAGERLERLGIGYETMSGATSNRRQVIERFQNDPECRVLLMTLKTGGVGLNLTVADTVIIFEPWWNKAAEEQAINRLHRIGQKAKVMSFSLYTRDTIEEKIKELQDKKSLLVDAIISSDSGSGKQLSEEDINFILAPATTSKK